MKKNRFLIALIAASTSLAGCGKKDKTPADDTPSGDQGGGGSGGDEDKLTPAQQEEANEIKLSLDSYLAQAFEGEVVVSLNSYTVAYSEEIARENVSASVISEGLGSLALLIGGEDPSAIVPFVLEQNENGKLKDILYGGVALGKSMLRGASKTVEEGKDELEFAADYLDEEGIELHKNIYGLASSTAALVSTFVSKDFVDAVGEIYDAEKNEVSFAKLAVVMQTVGMAVLNYSRVYENVGYLADLAARGAAGFVGKFIPESEDIVEFINGLDVKGVVQQLFSYVGMAGMGIYMLSSEDSPVAHVVDLINLALQEKYEELITALVEDYLVYIETDISLAQIQAETGAIYEIYEGIAGKFSSEAFVALTQEVMAAEDEEAAVAKMKELVLAVADILEDASDAKENVSKLFEYGVDIVKCSLVAIGGYSEEEAAAKVESFDSAEFVKGLFDSLESAIAFMRTVGESTEGYEVEFHAVFEVIQAVKGGDTTEIVMAIFTGLVDILYEEFEIESIDKNGFKLAIFVSVMVVIGSYQYVQGDEFKELLNGLIATDEETGSISVSPEGVIAFCEGVAGSLVDGYVTVAGALIAVINVIEEVVLQLDPEATDEEKAAISADFAVVTGALNEIVTALSDASAFLKDEDAINEHMDEILFYGNLVVEAIEIGMEIESTGNVDMYRIVEFVVRAISLLSGNEPTPVAISSFDAIEGKVAEAVGLEYVEQLIEGGETVDHTGRGIAFDVKENEGVYTLEVTVISSFSIVLEAGVVTSVSIVGNVYSFELPSFDFSALLGGGETAELVQANA